MPEIKYRCITKGTDREKGAPRYSQNWIISKRGILKFYDTHIELGSWKFEYDKIKNPVFYKSDTKIFPVKILAFDYQDKHYQFGLNPWVDPLPYLPFEPKLESTDLKMSIFSIILRIAVVIYIFYLLIDGLFLDK